MNLTADGHTLLVTNTLPNPGGDQSGRPWRSAYFAAQKTAKAVDDAVRAKAAAELKARIAAGQPLPGAEAALRKMIASIQSGTPDISLIANPQLAAAIQGGQAQVKALQGWGALQSISFAMVGPLGADVFTVVFEKQRTRWNIGMAPEAVSRIWASDRCRRDNSQASTALHQLLASGQLGGRVEVEQGVRLETGRRHLELVHPAMQRADIGLHQVEFQLRRKIDRPQTDGGGGWVPSSDSAMAMSARRQVSAWTRRVTRSVGSSGVSLGTLRI